MTSLNLAQEVYISEAHKSAAVTLLWQASDASEDGGRGFPISEGGNEYSEQVIAEVPYLSEAVTAFVRDNWDTLVSARVSAYRCGHDLILTANGHGAGFWGRGLGAAGDVLTEATRGYSFDAEFDMDEDKEITYLVVENVVLVDTEGLCD